MAFVSKARNLLKQTTIGRAKLELATYKPSVCQAIRRMSSSKVFVGGFPYSTDEMSLREAFAQYGEVVEARIVTDRDSGRSRGFGFVSYTSSDEASSAIQALDGKDFQGRMLRVNYAAERSRTDGFGGGGYSASGSNYGASGDYVSGRTSYTSGNRNYAGSGSGYGGGNYGNNGGVNGFGSSSYGGTSSSDAGNSGGYGGGSSFDGKDTSGNEDSDQDMMEENNKDDNDEDDYANSRG